MAAPTVPPTMAPDVDWAEAVDAQRANRISRPVRNRSKVMWDSGERRALVGVRRFVRVIGAAHQRAGFDVHEPEIERHAFELAELVGMIVAGHRRVRRS